ncbi:MAG TPA: DUF502 domain-containing protein [Alphaproteobacteria bacterium]|jgi:uncharacterized membrane protein
MEPPDLSPPVESGLQPSPIQQTQTRTGFFARLRTWLFAGVLVTAPIVITFYLIWWVISFVDAIVTPMIPVRYQPETYLQFGVPGLGVVIVLLGLTIIGGLTTSLLGRYFLSLSDRLLARMPVVRGIYGATKQVFETIFSSQGNAFRSVVLVEFPRAGAWSLGFITATTTGEIAGHATAPLVNVFVPTTPNPTSGYLLFVPRKDVIELHMTVEEGIKMIVSGGIVTPADRSKLSHRDVR